MDTIVTESSTNTQAEPRYQREARVATDFGTLLHQVTTKIASDVDGSFIAAGKKDAIRRGCVELINEVLELDPDLDIFDLLNLLNDGRLL